MKIAALLVFALLPAASAFAQSVALTAPEADLQELVGCYPAATAPARPAGRVTYFGVVNTHDAGHEQFARLRQALAASQATVILYEKPDMGVDSTEAATITRLGESGYVRFLAQQRGIRAERFDDLAAEYEYLRAHVAPAQLQLYYLLQASQQLRKNTGASKALIIKAMQQLVATSATFMPGSGPAFRSRAEFEAAYRQHCPTGGPWWKRPLGPADDFTQRLDQDLSAFRSQRLSQKVAAHVRAGERVLVVLNRSHLPAPAAYATRTPARR